MKHSSLIIISFLLSSCGSANTAFETPTATSTITSTVTPLSTATLTPTPISTPIPVTYIYGDEVSAEERAEFELGMRSTYIYLSEQDLGSPSPQTVIALYDVEQMTDISYPLYGPEFNSTKDQVRSIWQGAATAGMSPEAASKKLNAQNTADSSATNAIILPAAIPTGGGPNPLAAIFVLTSIPKEFYDYPCYKVEYIAHDIWHTMQRQWAKLPLRSGYPMPRTGPEWLKEGSAQYFSFKVAAKAHPDVCEFTKEFGVKTGDFNISLKLGDMESSASLATVQNQVFSLGALAVDYLVDKSPKGIGSLKDFYEGIGQGLSPDDAFKVAFGQSTDEFYVAFQNYEQQKLSSIFDESGCKDFGSSGDFIIKCVGKFTNDNSSGTTYRFEVSGFNPDNIRFDQWKITSDCAIGEPGWNKPFLDIFVFSRNETPICSLTVSIDKISKSAQVTFRLDVYDESTCVTQLDPQIKCLGSFDKDNLTYYIFELPFNISPEVFEWKIETNCKIARLSTQGYTIGKSNQILIGVDKSVHGSCQAKFIFTDSNTATVGFVVP